MTHLYPRRKKGDGGWVGGFACNQSLMLNQTWLHAERSNVRDSLSERSICEQDRPVCSRSSLKKKCKMPVNGL